MSSSLFDIEMDSPHINEGVLDDYPKLKEISDELIVAGSLQGSVKILKLDEIYQKLADERANITEIRKAIDYLMKDIRGIIHEEGRGDEVRRQMPR